LSNPSEFPAKLLPLFRPARYKTCYGGRGAGRSWGIARALIEQGWQKPLRILCGREVQRSISESVHQLLADQINRMGLADFYTITETEIQGRNGTQFNFSGLRHQDIHKVKSLEGIDILWVEESEPIRNKSWDIIIPTIRKEGSEIWQSFNPGLDTADTYQRFVVNPPADSVVIKMTWRDNPWFPAVLEAERTALQSRDPEAYRNVWEGEPRSGGGHLRS
jgi:phage terminase large subunit